MKGFTHLVLIMKKNRLISWGLLLCAAILSLNSCTFGDDEKDIEIVDDPMVKTVQYFIVGTVFDTDTESALAGVTVKTGDTSVTTDNNGRYEIIVDTKKTYQLEFSKDNKYVKVTADATIASGAPNRSMVTLGVKMKAISEHVTIRSESASEIIVSDKGEGDHEDASTTIHVPAGASEEECSISITPYEAPQHATTTVETGTKNILVALKNVAIETSKTTEFKKELTVTVKNLASPNAYFDPGTMELWSIDEPTRAPAGWEKEETVIKWNNGNYSFNTHKLKSKYTLEIYTERQIGAENNSEYNLVNGQTELKVDNSGNANAIRDIDITVEAKTGWNFTVSPAQALTTAGVTGDDQTKMAATIKNIIETQEGGFAQIYTVTQNLKASVSGNHIMYYRNRAKFCEKTYIFDIVVQGGKNTTASVKVKAYTGSEEIYQNEQATQHSGGSI